MIEFTGKLNDLVFENKQDLFKILDVEIIGELAGYSRETIHVTGNFGDLQAGQTYKFKGDLIVHEKFGLQFKASQYVQVMPHEQGSLTKYLSSDKFPGIGKKAAETIIHDLGLEALSVLKEKPAKVATLNLTSKQKASLMSGLSQMDSYAEIILKLSQLGLTQKLGGKLYKLYHGDALKKLQADPYQAIDNVKGYGFKIADQIGHSLNIAKNDPRRISGAIYQVLNDALTYDCNTYVPLRELLTKASELLEIKVFNPVADSINLLQEKGKIVVENDCASLQHIYQTETEIASHLKRLLTANKDAPNYSETQIRREIKKVEHTLKIRYDETQKLAIQNALQHPISILTGGPGTGKTTIIRGILQCLRELEAIPAAALYSTDPPFLLAAPTGRAAKRMAEMTGITAKTIHRLLGLGIGNNVDDHDLNELNGQILIIDEMSMVDMFLFKQLLSAIHETTHIVFVGDKDQLPSVGAGNVFSDLIAAQAIPTVVLKQIHRQADESSIITLAHAVNSGKNDAALFEKTKNYSFISCRPELVSDAVAQIVKLALKRFDQDEIQVLGAMYHGNGGINHLNDVLQRIMNPKLAGAKEIESHHEIFRIGDRILQLQNNPEKDIYNGQIGKVTGINLTDHQHCLIADFDGREVSFAQQDLMDLTRAYAITIHKAQGSEFPLVILNLTMQNFVMLRRNLLYTAITRAAKNLVMVGEKRAYISAFQTPGNDRHTGLTNQIKQQLKLTETQAVTTADSLEKKLVPSEQMPEKEVTFILTTDKIYSGEIDPMIGMANIKLEHIPSQKKQ